MEEIRQITIEEWMQWKENIHQRLDKMANDFVYIGYHLKKLRDSGMYDGAADFYELAQKEFSLGKSTVSRFIAINEKYSEGGNSLELKEEFKRFSSSKLSEMLTLPDSEVGLITEKTTIREIRELKAFNSQKPEDEGEPEGIGTGETAGAAGGEERRQTPLGKCLTDFFKDKKDMLNGVMRHLEEEPPAYKEAAELIAPSQTSHKKGIVFLFLYDWNTGVKYKLMTEPEPVSMSWAELLNIIYGIFGTCEKDDVAAPVATSQQNEGREQDNEKNGEQEKPVEKAENQNVQEAAGGEDEESSESKAQGEACADSGQIEGHSVEPEPADEAPGAAGGEGGDSTGGGAGVAPVQPGSGQLRGQMDISDHPEYMPDAETDGQENTAGAAGVEGEPEKPEKTRTEAKTEAAAGGEDSDKKITDFDGMERHIENQKQIIADAISLMSTYCSKGIWDGLIEEANAIITRVESIKNMVEVWNG